MSLFGELKRRNVFRVGAAYGVISWLVLQVGDLAADNLGFPGWFMPMILVVLAIGLPIALLFAWAFELTPDGVKKTADVDKVESITASTGQTLNYVIIAGLILIAGYFIWESRFQDTADQDTRVAGEITDKSIAVLPFASFSEDAEQGWFADGLTEEILNALARTRDLLVSSRTSSFAYRETTKDIRVIASELGVAHVLEGSVRRSGKRVRVTAQLIRASDGFHLWSETYDRDFDDIIEIQEDVAINIANALQTAMDPEALAAMVDAGTSSVSAYEAYIEGLALSRAIVDEQGTTAARAIGRLNEAVRIDPDFAFAQAELARSWFGDLEVSNIGFALEGSVAEKLALGHRHADLAIAAFGDRPGANPMRGLKARNDLRLKDAAAFFEKALAEEPNSWVAYIDLINIRIDMGERAGANLLVGQAYATFPKDSFLLSGIIISYVWTVTPAKAAAAADEAMARFPRDANLAYQAHRAYLMNGEIDKAAALLPVVSGSSLPVPNKIMIPLRQACATGDVEMAKQLHGQMQSLDNVDESSLWLAAQTMGDYDLAQAQLALLDTPEHLIELSSFLLYYHFDLARYPNLKAVLDAQGINRPAPQPVTFGCQRWREGE